MIMGHKEDAVMADGDHLIFFVSRRRVLRELEKLIQVKMGFFRLNKIGRLKEKFQTALCIIFSAVKILSSNCFIMLRCSRKLCSSARAAGFGVYTQQERGYGRTYFIPFQSRAGKRAQRSDAHGRAGGKARLQQVLAALDEGSSSGLTEVIDGDADINKLEVEIDDACQTIIARRQPGRRRFGVLCWR